MTRNQLHRFKRIIKMAHGAQTRKYTGLPYSTHLEDVTDQVMMASTASWLEAAAYAHDCLEDTPMTPESLYLLCRDVGMYEPEAELTVCTVMELTHAFTPEN